MTEETKSLCGMCGVRKPFKNTTTVLLKSGLFGVICNDCGERAARTVDRIKDAKKNLQEGR